MRLSEMKEGVFWMEQSGRLSWTVIVLRRLELGKWRVLVSNSLGKQFVTDWNDYEKSPVTKELR